MVTSAMTRTRVPASVDSSPPLYVPRDSREDMTLERSAKLTPNDLKEIKTKTENKNHVLSELANGVLVC